MLSTPFVRRAGKQLMASLAILGDLVAAKLDVPIAYRLLFALTALSALVLTRQASVSDLGLRRLPRPGSAKPILLLLAGYALLTVVVLWWSWPYYFTGLPPDPSLLGAVVDSVLMSPLVEETVYRAFVMGCLLSTRSMRLEVVVSASLFLLVHVLYGNAHLEHFAAGLVLATSYAMTGTLWVPIALHALGNASVWAWHWSIWALCGDGSLCLGLLWAW